MLAQNKKWLHFQRNLSRNQAVGELFERFIKFSYKNLKKRLVKRLRQAYNPAAISNPKCILLCETMKYVFADNELQQFIGSGVYPSNTLM